jgi:chromosome segregation ATPase
MLLPWQAHAPDAPEATAAAVPSGSWPETSSAGRSQWGSDRGNDRLRRATGQLAAEQNRREQAEATVAAAEAEAKILRAAAGQLAAEQNRREQAEATVAAAEAEAKNLRAAVSQLQAEMEAAQQEVASTRDSAEAATMAASQAVQAARQAAARDVAAAAEAAAAARDEQVRNTPSWPRNGPTPTFYSRIPT